jgi:ribosomal protein S18 acetylase RimI-like enzyme
MDYKVIHLDQVSLAQITACFNEAFSDYFVKFVVDEPYLKNRFAAASVDYSLSYGVIHNDELVAFIVHGIDIWRNVKTVFNGGTGVVPAHRGNSLVTLMYEKAIPELKSNGIHQACLEVIQENDKAIHLYKKAGFEIERGLHCYNGALNLAPKFEHVIKKCDFTDLDIPYLSSFWNFEPAWEMHWPAVAHKRKQVNCRIIEEDETIVAYLIYENNGAIMQFGVKPSARGQGLGYSLFQYLSTQVKKVKLNNVDANDIQTNQFLKTIGFQNVIDQYEMHAKF